MSFFLGKPEIQIKKSQIQTKKIKKNKKPQIQTKTVFCLNCRPKIVKSRKSKQKIANPNKKVAKSKQKPKNVGNPNKKVANPNKKIANPNKNL
jgi:hypothetical protein